MADITNVFKATIKTVKIREKALGSTPAGPDKSILPTCHKMKSEFTANASEVVTTICKLRDFLLEHRKDYLNTTGHLGGEQSKMTDRERDQIDADAELYIKTCSEAIRHLKTQAHSYRVLRQVKEHKEAVLDLIDKYLSAVCQLYSEQRAVRVRRVVDRKRIARLEPISSSSGDHTKTWQEAVRTEADNKPESSRDASSRLQRSGSGSAAASVAIADADTPDEPLSDEETHLLQLENQQLFEEMSSMVDEVRQIEGKIVEISRLQEIFADKVLEQDRGINKVADTVVGTTENIKEGNEQIREAMKNNAAFRIWILFFLIVCTLSLLFLDWYNA